MIKLKYIIESFNKRLVTEADDDVFQDEMTIGWPEYSMKMLQALFKTVYLSTGTPKDRARAQWILNSFASQAKRNPNTRTTDKKTWKDFLKWQEEFKKTTKPKGISSGDFDIGQRLFADPNDTAVQKTDQYAKFLKQAAIEVEPNTPDENEFLYMLGTYIEDNATSPNLIPSLKALKRLKAKFPRILDPQNAKKATQYAYRGMKIPMEILLKHRAKDMGNYIEFQGPITITTEQSFSSFSLRPEVADKFQLQQMRGMFSTVAGGDIPATIIISIDDPNLLLNPDWLKQFAIKGFGSEQETFYLSKKIVADKISILKEAIIKSYYSMQDSEEYDQDDNSKYGLKRSYPKQFMKLFKTYIPNK